MSLFNTPALSVVLDSFGCAHDPHHDAILAAWAAGDPMPLPGAAAVTPAEPSLADRIAALERRVQQLESGAEFW